MQKAPILRCGWPMLSFFGSGGEIEAHGFSALKFSLPKFPTYTMYHKVACIAMDQPRRAESGEAQHESTNCLICRGAKIFLSKVSSARLERLRVRSSPARVWGLCFTPSCCTCAWRWAGGQILVNTFQRPRFHFISSALRVLPGFCSAHFMWPGLS